MAVTQKKAGSNLSAMDRIAAARDKLKTADSSAQNASTALTRIAAARQKLKATSENSNTALSRSGEGRDTFDSNVRNSYAKKAASTLVIPPALIPALTTGGSILTDTKAKTVAVGGGRDGIDTKEVQVPTAMSRIANVLTGAAKDWAGSNVNAAGMAVKGAQELNTLASGTAQKVQAAKDNIAQYQQEIQTQRRSGTLTNESLSHLNQLISANNRAIQAAEGTLEAQNTGTETGAQALNQTADKWQASGQQNVSTAKQGLGSVGSALVDIGVAGTQMAADAGAAALTGSSALVPMFIRSFGGGAQQARQAGASTGTQALYGLGSGVIETATEKISNVAAPFRKMFGAGVLDSAVQKVIGKLAQDSVGKALLTAGASAAGEGFEEFVGDLVYPVLQRATFNKDAKFNLGDSLYDAMIGGALGLIGGAPAVVSSVDSKISDAMDARTQNSQQATEQGTVDAQQQAVQPNNTQTGEITPAEQQTGYTGKFNAEEQAFESATPDTSSNIQRQEAKSNKAADVTQAPNANGQGNTPKASLASSSTAEPILSQSSQNIKGDVLADTSVGAAKEGFDPYSRLQNQTDAQNFHDDGANAARVVDVPKINFEGRNIPESAKTIMGARAIDDADVVQIEKEIVSGKLAFDTITDEKSVTRARKAVSEKGFDGAMEQYRNAVNSGISSKDNTTLGQQLLLQAMREGNSANVAELLNLYTRNSTTIAQSMQAQSIFRKLSPEGQLVAVQRAVSALGEKHDIDLTIPQEDIDEFLNADDEGRDKALDTIYDDVAKQVPGTFSAKFDTIRYLAMLGNPKTHIRNILGNTLFQIPVSVKNRVGAVGEAIGSAVSGGKIERTKSILPANPAGALAKECFADWSNAKDFLTRTNKYSDSASGKIEERQKAFTQGIGKGIQTVADANTALLELEDNATKRWIYSNSLAGYLKANGAKFISEADSALLNRARNYAAKEALKGTFNDTNALSSAVSKLGRLHTSDNLAEKAAGYLVEGELPFKKTPANIVMRGLEYSPGGFVVGIYQTAKGAKSGDSATVTAGIDHIASGVSGMALLTAGALLRAAGYITGGNDEDDKKQKFWEMQGHQNYALEIGGKSFTLDWLSPSAIPFFIGVQISKAFEDSDLSWNDLLGVVKSANDPLLEMTMLQGLNDTFNSAAYAKYNGGSVFGNIIASAATNYLTQVIPTLGGQIERSGETTRKSTFTDRNSSIPSDAQYLLGKVSQKIPGLDYNQMDYVDAWGRTQDQGSAISRIINNFINPSYTSKDRSEAVDSELQRLYDAGFSGVLPERVSQSTKVGDQYMTQGEYVKYSTEKGQKALSLVSDFMGSDTYKDISDEARAAVIQDIYSYSTDRAKKAILEGRGEKYESNWDSKDKISDLPEYLAVKEGFADAFESRNFNAVDALLSAYKTMPESTKDALGRTIEKAAEASDGGMDSKTWFSVQDVVSAIVPESGKSGVSTKQKYTAISDMDNLSDGQKLLAMFGFDSESDNTYERYDAASKAGIPVTDWTDFTGKLDSSISQAELKTAINTMSWSRSQKAAAWEIYSDTKHWKAANPWG